MIRYKRIYPLRENGRLAAIVTVIGGKDGSEVSVKFKNKPECNDLVIIFFNPKTYEYEMLPLQDRMHVTRPMTSLTACVIAYKKGIFIDFLMEGSISKCKLCTSKLKSAIAMDMYARDESQGQCLPCQQPEAEQPPCITPEGMIQGDDSEAHEMLMDYLKSIEKDEVPTPHPALIPDGQKPPEIQRYNHSPQIRMAEETEREMSKQAQPKEAPCPQGISLSKELTDAKRQYCEFINPFKDRWDGVWWKVQYPDKNWHYIVGRVIVDGQNVSVLGIPGERSTKPVCLESCDMFAVDDGGTGYWLMFQK